MSTQATTLKEYSRDRRDNTAMIEAVKALHVMVAAVMADVAALRRTVLEDPTFALAYDAHLKAATRTVRPLLTEALESYDALIENFGTLDEWSH